VKPFVAIWMEENPVICFVSATLTSPDDMVAVPPCQFGDFPVAEWAKACAGYLAHLFAKSILF